MLFLPLYKMLSLRETVKMDLLELLNFVVMAVPIWPPHCEYRWSHTLTQTNFNKNYIYFGSLFSLILFFTDFAILLCFTLLIYLLATHLTAGSHIKFQCKVRVSWKLCYTIVIRTESSLEVWIVFAIISKF